VPEPVEGAAVKATSGHFSRLNVRPRKDSVPGNTVSDTNGRFVCGRARRGV
jgi:hypothetical protein